ncbi:MAG: DUF819 family protein [Clostridia bacterium]|nr:DUF819 family protein [Clostridia bacterium]
MNAYTIASLIVMLILPAGAVALCRRVHILNVIGAVALCYVAGLVISLLPVPYDKGMTQTVASVAVALAIPLILFGFDLRSVRRLTAKTTLGLTLQFIAVAASASAVFFISEPLLGLENAAPLSGMAMGLYTGGTPNLVATGNALLPSATRTETILAANTADFLVGGVYFLMILTVVRPLYRRFLGNGQAQAPKNDVKTDDTSVASCDSSVTAFVDEYDYGFLKNDKKRLLNLALCVLLAVACLGVGALLEILINGNMDGSLYIMVTVSVLGLALSFVPRVRKAEGTYPVGQYLILVFSLGLSMSLDLSALARELLPTLAFFAMTQVLTVIVHLLLCKLFRVDGGTALITSTAGIYGPPFIAPVANSYGDRSLIVPGIVCGVFGLAVGNLVGIGLGSLLSLF